MIKPESWDIAELGKVSSNAAVAWVAPSVRARVSEVLRCPIVQGPDSITQTVRTLIVAGGGTLLDEAKYLRKTQYPDLRLIALPSIWGSGAERSPVVVLNRAGRKEFHVDPSFLPDAVVYWPELLETVPPWRARYACGDAWAHVLEAFFSPVAGPALRAEAAILIRRMLGLPLATDAAWLDASGRAAALQAASSVGLIHGIAHTLEMPLVAEHPGEPWSHSRLCALFLYPVMNLNRSVSFKCANLCSGHDVDLNSVLETVSRLFEPRSYHQALPMLAKLWPAVLRDPSTRTNGALVRSGYLEYFEKLRHERVA